MQFQHRCLQELLNQINNQVNILNKHKHGTHWTKIMLPKWATHYFHREEELGTSTLPHNNLDCSLCQNSQQVTNHPEVTGPPGLATPLVTVCCNIQGAQPTQDDSISLSSKFNTFYSSIYSSFLALNQDRTLYSIFIPVYFRTWFESHASALSNLAPPNEHRRDDGWLIGLILDYSCKVG